MKLSGFGFQSALRQAGSQLWRSLWTEEQCELLEPRAAGCADPGFVALAVHTISGGELRKSKVIEKAKEALLCCVHTWK